MGEVIGGCSWFLRERSESWDLMAGFGRVVGMEGIGGRPSVRPTQCSG